MARYAQFTAESFAARTRQAPPPPPASDGDYGSLLVVRVGRPRKRPVLLLDPAEAAADAIRFQQIAAHDFANPDEAVRRSAVVRLSAIAANESGLEVDDAADAVLPEADEALALWTNPAEPVDTSDWNDGEGEPIDEPPAAFIAPAVPPEAPAPLEAPAPAMFAPDPEPEPVEAFAAQPVMPEIEVLPEPVPPAEALAPVTEPMAEAHEPAPMPDPEPWLAEADPEFEPQPGLLRRIADAIRNFLALF